MPADSRTLARCGVAWPQDDAVILEFESPSVPDPLKLLRSPVAEKPQKDKGGKKKKK